MGFSTDLAKLDIKMKSTITEGGMAFPGNTGYSSMITGCHWDEGMSMRDWFATNAMAKLIESALDLNHKSWEATAEHAYRIADAMIAARGNKD